MESSKSFCDFWEQTIDSGNTSFIPNGITTNQS